MIQGQISPQRIPPEPRFRGQKDLGWDEQQGEDLNVGSCLEEYRISPLLGWDRVGLPPPEQSGERMPMIDVEANVVFGY
jgi:hypothetical protein